MTLRATGIFRRPIPVDPPPGPGLLAIDRRVDRIDGGPALHRYRPRAPQRFGSGGPLRAITVHRVRDPDHWHLVTRGLTELDEKESDDPGQSGWGFELTMRIPVETGTDPAAEPSWAADLLTNLAAYVWTTGHGFAPGHHVDLRGPVKLDVRSPLTAAVTAVDPTLGRMKGPFGRLTFLQLVPVTADELELCRTWSTDGVLAALAETDPLWITRLDRPSLLADPGRAAELLAHAGVEGGELSDLRVATLSVKKRPSGTVIQLGGGASAALGPALRRELVGEGARFTVVGDEGEIRFVVAPVAAWRHERGRLELDVPLDEVDGLAALFDGRDGWGRRPGWPGLRWHVVK